MAIVIRHENCTAINIEPGQVFYVGLLVIDGFACGVVWGEAGSPDDFRRQVAEQHGGTVEPIVDLALEIELQNRGLVVIDASSPTIH